MRPDCVRIIVSLSACAASIQWFISVNADHVRPSSCERRKTICDS